MPQREKPDLTVVSGKGQVVIPAAIRAKLGWEPKTKLLVYSYEDVVILKKFEVPDLSKELEAMHKRIKARIAKYGKLTNEEINEIIHEQRRIKAKRRDSKKAYDGKADYIVSGDKRLLSLREFRGTKILTVNEVLNFLEK